MQSVWDAVFGEENLRALILNLRRLAMYPLSLQGNKLIRVALGNRLNRYRRSFATLHANGPIYYGPGFPRFYVSYDALRSDAEE